jgi:TctA family transporter
MFIMVGAYIPNKSFGDVFVTFGCGVLGYFMKEYKYPRIGLLLAMVLTFKMELNYFMAMDRFGISMFARPVVLVIIALIVFSLGNDFRKKSKKRRAGYSK